MLAGSVGGCASISEAPGDGIDGGSKVDVRVNLDKASKIVGNPMDCGNSKIDTGEDCDDGNKDSGDGCSDMCQREAGWVCTTPGQKCDPPRCGDANLTENKLRRRQYGERRRVLGGLQDCRVGLAVPGSGQAVHAPVR